MKRTIPTLAFLLAIAGCGGATSDGDDSETTTTASSGPAVSTAETSLGTVLVDPDGLTLYIFTNDTGPDSTCYDECAVTWPPVPAVVTISPELDESLFGSTTRNDGSEQLTVSGQPLYLFVGDSSPGDVNGQNIEGIWFVVGPDGVAIGLEASGSQSGTNIADGYGYGSDDE